MRLEKLRRGLVVKHRQLQKTSMIIDWKSESTKYCYYIPLHSFNNMAVRVNAASAIEVSTIGSVINEEEINMINMIRSIMG